MMENITPPTTYESRETTAKNLEIRKPTMLQVGILYSVCVLLLIFIGSRVQQAEFYSGILITEFILIMLPAILLLILFKYDVKKVLRLNKISFVNIILIIGIMCSALPIVGVLNGINLVLIKKIFGKLIINQPPIPDTGLGLLISVLVIGGSAGICEEILFRGTIQRGFERLGTVKAILLASLLFGLMHIDFQKLLGTFLLGGLIGFIVYRTNSIFGGIAAHFTNNSIAVILSFGANKLNQIVNPQGSNKAMAGDIDMSVFLNLPREQKIAVIIVWAFIFIVALAFFILFTFLLTRTTSKIDRDVQAARQKAPKWQMIGILPGAAMIVFVYLAQGLKLKGIVSPVMESIIRFLGLK